MSTFSVSNAEIFRKSVATTTLTQSLELRTRRDSEAGIVRPMMRLSKLMALFALLTLTPACDDPGVLDPTRLTYQRIPLRGHFSGEAFLAAEPIKKLCIRIMIELDNPAARPPLFPGIHTPEGTAVKQIDITDDFTDCAIQQGGGGDLATSHGDTEPAATASGTIDSTSLHVTLQFTAGDVIPEQSIALDADDLPQRQ